MLELGRVEAVFWFEIRRQEAMSTAGRRGMRTEDVAGEEEDGEGEGENDPYAVL